MNALSGGLPPSAALEILDVGLHRLRIAQCDRAFDVRHDDVPSAFILDEQLVDDAGEGADVGCDERRAVGEAGVALDHVVAESDLAHLAVADDVDAGLDLLGDDFGDRLLHACRELDRVDRLFVELVPHHADEIVRTREAPGVRRQDTLGAALH